MPHNLLSYYYTEKNFASRQKVSEWVSPHCPRTPVKEPNTGPGSTVALVVELPAIDIDTTAKVAGIGWVSSMSGGVVSVERPRAGFTYLPREKPEPAQKSWNRVGNAPDAPPPAGEP